MAPLGGTVELTKGVACPGARVELWSATAAGHRGGVGEPGCVALLAPLRRRIALR